MKIFYGIVLAFIVLGSWYYFNQENSGSNPRNPSDVQMVAQRPLIDPDSFDRKEALLSLAELESASSFSFGSYASKSVGTSSLPIAILPFVTPGTGERVKVAQDVYNPALFVITYFSENPMPENYLSQLRLTSQNGWKVVRGVRNELASMIDMESETQRARISQLAVSEERTEVFISVKNK